jgi:outer membrane lipoprotein SlyB
MGPFEMVLGIVIVATVGNVLKARYGGGKGRRRDGLYGNDAGAIAENQLLKGEIGSLKERIAVLERVVTDNEGSLRLDREIEKLRDARRD